MSRVSGDQFAVILLSESNHEKIVALADYDGDGKSDLLWRNSSSGQTYLYPMDGRTIKSTEGYLRTVPTSWSVVGR